MALLSPGVQVSVTDESFSTGAGPGTVPLVFVATKQDKTTPDGTATAVGTTAANANNLYLISSQRELLQTFGNPDFNEVGGSAQNGYPLNEYGLLAAYSYLGLANRAYVIRADIDLAELDPLSIAPTGDAVDNTYWVDLNEFTPGLFISDASSNWTAVDVDVIVNPSATAFDTSSNVSGRQVGDIIAVFYPASVDATTGVHLEYYNFTSGGTWAKLDGGALANEIYQSPHYTVPTGTAGDLWLKTTTPNSGLSLNLKRYDATLAQFVDLGTTPIFQNPTAYYASSGVTASAVTAGTVVGFVDSTDNSVSGEDVLDVVFQSHSGATTTSATGTATPTFVNIVAADSIDITLGAGAAVTVAFTGAETTVDELATTINTDADVIANGNIVASSTTLTGGAEVLVITATNGADVTLANNVNTPLAEMGYGSGGTYSNFSDLDSVSGVTYAASLTTPAGDTAYGTYWYDANFNVDLLVKDAAGTGWIEVAGTVSTQADAPTSPSNGDIWVETDSGTSYPVIYRRTAGAWVLVDNTDQTSPLGIIFADARPTNSSAAANGVNNGGGGDPDLDSDAPDPALYPGGTLLWNTRYSGRNVKVWTQDAATTDVSGLVSVDRWVSASGNNLDGSLITGAAAQKKVVINAIAATITANEDVRNDTIFYNLIAAPGFTELMDEMLTLNTDRKEQAFVIGDAPFSLSNATTDLQAWSSNANNAAGNGDDGLVTTSPYLGVYYPSGLSTNVDGSEVVVPASHMVLRQMAFNDQVAYPWFAPAGFSRGTISNSSAVGYLDSEDEFVTVALNEGQRDTLYTNNVNAIATLPGRGIVIWGQKTRNPVAGSLDRVNVARLVNYIRYQSDLLAQPFLFEPNDTVTRDAVKEAFDSFLAELVTLRGVTDFLVVVDESNNTPARIDRNELWVDIAIQPTKAVEFIFIPIRLRNTGDDLNL